jgi:tRNA (adenine37-N6)-methyltransferase
MAYLLNPIGIIHSCFKEKFGIPRQPGLAPAAKAELELFNPYGSPESLRGLSGFSHIWIVFVFHVNRDKGWKPTVRPPRLGGNMRIGVFASRSGFRPNGIGMSVVKLDRVCTDSSTCRLHLSGVDILDQTPVLDIKPYIPYSDSIPESEAGFADAAPSDKILVVFSASAEAVCHDVEQKIPLFRQLIIQILQHDPRPAYYTDRAENKSHGIRIYDFDIKWKYLENHMVVTTIEPTFIE